MRTLNEGYVSIRKAGDLIDVSSTTIARWYRWWENDNFPKPECLYLPPYYYKDNRRTKFFKVEDIPLLKKFSKDIRGPFNGVMAEFNAALQWGKRGARILENKGTSKKEVKSKF